MVIGKKRSPWSSRARRRAAALALSFAMAMANGAAWSEPNKTALFKVITERDDIIVGLNPAEIQALGGSETNPAGRIAQALASSGALTVWRYSVRKAANGDSQLAPLNQVGLLAKQTLRVEPYQTPFAIVPRE